MVPGSLKGLMLVADSAEDAKALFDQNGIATSEIENQPWGKHVYFSDPDGNSCTSQESFARHKQKA